MIFLFYFKDLEKILRFYQLNCLKNWNSTTDLTLADSASRYIRRFKKNKRKNRFVVRKQRMSVCAGLGIVLPLSVLKRSLLRSFSVKQNL
jgi:hypothetical protein